MPRAPFLGLVRARSLGLPGARRTASVPLRHACRAALPCVLAVLLSACGSYGKRDFVARAEAICASSVRQLRALGPGSGNLSDYLARAVPIAGAEAHKIELLQRPGGSARQQAQLNAYLAALRRSVSQLRALAAAASHHDAAAASAAEAALRGNPLPRLAADYGLRACGAPGATVS